MKVVLSLSGGVDSSTLLAFYCKMRVDKIFPLFFLYGSKHNEFEIKSSFEVAKYYREKGFPIEERKVIDLRNVFSEFSSVLLLKNEEEIPEGHYNDETMRKTVVPSRNFIFAAIMSGYAESVGANLVALGVHKGDHYIYPDCRKDFVEQLDKAILYASEGKVGVDAPFIDLDKKDIVKIGLELKVPYELTRTCYKNQPVACGKCGSCRERIEAFELNNTKDFIQYE